jgi:replicative DNA helicase
MNENKLTSQMFDPYTERAVLHACVFDGRFEACRVLIGKDDFAEQRHQRLWEICEVLTEAGEEINLSTACQAIACATWRTGHDISWLVELGSEYPVITNPAPWAKRLRQKRIDREAYQTLSQLSETASRGEFDPAAATDKIAAIKGQSVGGLQSIGSILEHLGGIEAITARPRNVVSTPWPSLNHALAGGFRGGELILLAARPGMGKTSLALQVAAAASVKVPVLFLSLEMKRSELLRRLIAGESGVRLRDLIEGTLDQGDRYRVMQATAALETRLLDLRDNIGKLGEALEAIRQSRARLVVIDYLGLLLHEKRTENKNAEVSAISRALKLEAMRLDVPILCLSQLSRATESRTDHRPVLSDLRDSGSLEQDADAVIFVYRAGYYKRDAEHLKRDAELIVAKQRNGISGVTLPLTFQAETCRFRELTEVQE